MFAEVGGELRVSKEQSVHQSHNDGRVYSAYLQYSFLFSLDLQVKG